MGSRFESILYPDRREAETREAPDCFGDLNLDQIVETVVAEWHDYDLAPFFYQPLHDADAVAYRQAVMRDLERRNVRQAMARFSARMRAMREHLDKAAKLYYQHEKELWVLSAVAAYCEAVTHLGEDLRGLDIDSHGLRALREYVSEYAASSAFARLSEEVSSLKTTLSGIRYSLLIRGTTVTVMPSDEEADYSAAVERTFEKFRQGAVRDYRVRFPEVLGLNHVGAQVLDGVAHLNPALFRALALFVEQRRDYAEPVITRFDREVQFYVAYLSHVDRLRRAGLAFCYPTVSATSKEVEARDAFDLALADKLIAGRVTAVPNDFVLHGEERVLVVSGPNHGGKTTYARMFGQMHYLASLGCAVPGTAARLFLCDRIFTHFEREETVETLRGKLQDDLVRLRHVVDQATPDSIVIVNEAFASTTVNDAVYLSREIMARLSALDVLSVWVTFLTEMASFSAKTVSVVSTVDPRDPAIRTFKLERREPDGLAYALAIAEKHRVTYAWLKERVRE